MTAAKTLTLEDGRTIGYEEYGVPNGRPIFYFHGFPGSRLEAKNFAVVASANAYRVIGVDRPGMGLSTVDTQRTFLSWAKDMEQIADRLEIEKFSIVGHSGAGPFVAACACAMSNRLNGVAIVSGMAPLEIAEAKMSMARGQRIIRGLIKALPWCASIMMRLTRRMLQQPKMLAQMIKQLPEADQMIFCDFEKRNAMIDATVEAFNGGISGPAEEMKMLLLKPWGFNLQDITCPVTIWHGALDTQVPVVHARLYAKLTPNASLEIIENEGHHSLLSNYAERILSSAWRA